MNEKYAKQPDREQFVRLLMRHDRVVRAYLRSLLPTATDVDEVMQEISVVAWRKFGELDDPDNFRRWICVIARYEVLMHRRKKARDRIVLGREIEELLADEGLEELSLRERQRRSEGDATLVGHDRIRPAGRRGERRFTRDGRPCRDARIGTQKMVGPGRDECRPRSDRLGCHHLLFAAGRRTADREYYDAEWPGSMDGRRRSDS